MKTHWHKIDNPNYLGAYSLLDGRENPQITATIEKVVEEQVKTDRGAEMCRVAYLKGLKPMILNNTNCKIIEKMYNTPYIEDWAGKNITIYVAKIKAFGDEVDALRIKKEAPKQFKKLINNSEDWNNVLKGLRSGYTMDQVRAKFVVSNEQEKELLDTIQNGNV